MIQMIMFGPMTEIHLMLRLPTWKSLLSSLSSSGDGRQLYVMSGERFHPSISVWAMMNTVHIQTDSHTTNNWYHIHLFMFYFTSNW